MSDYISRQAAVDEIYHHFPSLSRSEAAMVLHTVPSADVVEVVRCKDCEHFLTPHGCGHINGMVTAIDDGFCSYGERRTDG